MRSTCFFIILIAISINLSAQNIGIGTTSPHAGAILDISSGNKGVLVPRVSLSSTDISWPVQDPVEGLLIYNDNDTIYEQGFNLLTKAKGFYYWNGLGWDKLDSRQKGSLPRNGLVLLESREEIPGYSYIGRLGSSEYEQFIGSGIGNWVSLAASPILNTKYASSSSYGNKMFIWSGEPIIPASKFDSSGSIYNYASNSWTQMSKIGAPIGRARAATVTDSVNGYMLVWGGMNAKQSETNFSLTSTGAIYDLLYNSWYTLPATVLSARIGHAAVWAGNKMILWGGYNGATVSYSNGAYYNFTTNTWMNLSASPLAARYNHSAIWTGTKMIIWGGTNGTTIFNDGAAYDPATNSWETIAAMNLFPSSHSHSATWTGTDMVVFGGENIYGPTTQGYRYNVVSNAWSNLSTPPGAGILSTTGKGHSVVWNGSEIFFLGGKNTNYNLCVRAYNPVSNTWRLFNNLPGVYPREGAAAAWNGTHLFILSGTNTPVSGYKLDASSTAATDIHVNLNRVFYVYRKE